MSNMYMPNSRPEPSVEDEVSEQPFDLSGNSVHSMSSSPPSSPTIISEVLSRRNSTTSTSSFIFADLSASPSLARTSEEESDTSPSRIFPDLRNNVVAASSSTLNFLLGGYWPWWKSHEAISRPDFDVELLTHVHYAFAGIRDDGTVYLTSEGGHDHREAGDAYSILRAWQKQRNRRLGLKITLAIRGACKDVESRFVNMAADKQKLFNFTESVACLVDEWELDGVDINWFIPGDGDQARHYCDLLRSLRKRLGWHRWLTTALPVAKWALSRNDLVEVSKVVDFINLMAYNLFGLSFGGIPVTCHHAQLHQNPSLTETTLQYSGSKAIDYLIDQGVAPSKIVLGVPTYGYVCKGAAAPGQPFEDVITDEVKNLPRPGMSEEFSEDCVAAYSSGIGKFITYDNQQSVKRKAEYAKNKGLRGLFFWNLAGDRTGEESLLKAAYDTIHSERLERHEEAGVAEFDWTAPSNQQQVQRELPFRARDRSVSRTESASGDVSS